MIRHIRIQNFRSLVDVSVDLDPLTVLIGRSGTGKTNFVQAIRYLRTCLNLRNMNAAAQGGVQSILHLDHPKAPLCYDITFSIPGLDTEFHYSLQCNFPTGLLDESLKVDERELFHHSGMKWLVAPNVVPLPQPNTIMLGAIPGLQESTFAYVALRSGIGCYDFPGNVLATPGNQMTTAEQGLSDGAENYLLVADRILSDLSKSQSWKRIAKSVRVVNRAVRSLTLNAPTPDRLDVGHQLNGRLLSFDVRQESESFRRYLAHLLARYQNPSKQTLLFEHPESGLHPGAFEALAYEFIACPRDGRGQVILTTHSPQFLDCFLPETIRVVDLENLETRNWSCRSRATDIAARTSSPTW